MRIFYLGNVGRYVLALAALTAAASIFIVLFLGFSEVVKFLYPFTSILAGISAGIFVIVIIPLSLVKNLRLRLAAISLTLSMICGASVWMYSFLVIIGYIGWPAIFLAFLFHFVAPVAIIGLLLKGQWQAGSYLIAGLAITYLIRYYSFWLGSSRRERQNKFEVIDVEGEVVDDEKNKQG